MSIFLGLKEKKYKINFYSDYEKIFQEKNKINIIFVKLLN